MTHLYLILKKQLALKGNKATEKPYLMSKCNIFLTDNPASTIAYIFGIFTEYLTFSILTNSETMLSLKDGAEFQERFIKGSIFKPDLTCEYEMQEF